jgi:hypothetical protein
VIPKIIFQTHENSYIDLDKHQKINSSSWIKLNPEHEYVYMGAIEREYYVKKLSPELYQIYKNCNGMFQADIWRYVMVYHYGGFYADMDSICIKSLDIYFNKKIKYNMTCTEIQHTPIFEEEFVNNANFGAIKKCEIIKEVIDSIVNEYENYKKNTSSNKFNYIPLNRNFSNAVLRNKDKIVFNINDFTIHSSEFKTSSSYLDNDSGIVNFYGKMIPYKNFLKLDKYIE